MEPDHLLASVVGAAIGMFLGIGFAVVALVSPGSALLRAATAGLGFVLAALCGSLGCIGGFQLLWDMTRDVAWAGVGATVGAVLLAVAGGGLPVFWMAWRR